MAIGNQGIFPTSVHGQLADSYGLPTYTSSVNPFSATNAQGGSVSTGLQLGQGWLLFDFTIVQLLKSVGAIAANAACNFQAGNSNAYNVQSAVVFAAQANGTVPVTALNDRGGAITVSGGINWMTTTGLGTSLVAASQTASTNSGGVALGASSVSGQLTGVTVGTYLYNNVLLLNNTTTAGAYPVLVQ